MESCEFDKKSAKQSDLRAPLTQPYSQIQRHNAVYTKNCRNLLCESLLIFTCYQSVFQAYRAFTKRPRYLLSPVSTKSNFTWFIDKIGLCRYAIHARGKNVRTRKKEMGEQGELANFPLNDFNFHAYWHQIGKLFLFIHRKCHANWICCCCGSICAVRFLHSLRLE